ncbi:MAG TPA: hypothetical protein PK649_11975 [Vicingus sp.]|nr:hypothetical protein [Vicingus sp.]
MLAQQDFPAVLSEEQDDFALAVVALSFEQQPFLASFEEHSFLSALACVHSFLSHFLPS